MQSVGRGQSSSERVDDPDPVEAEPDVEDLAKGSLGRIDPLPAYFRIGALE